ncbi:MAG: type II toxin-antitoxin system RelE/ParE family toxin [Flavobacteriales bacterium]
MRLLYTRPARQRLVGIEDYFSLHASPKAAARLVDGLLTKALGLLKHPKKGKPERLLAHRGLGHRSLSAGRFLIIYYVEGDTIHITDFFDTRQHPSRMRG